MVRECILCKRLDLPNDDISFHSFPKKQEDKRIWLSLIGLDESHLNKNPVLCSEHFNITDFSYYRDGIKRLKPGSVPILSHSTLQVESSDLGSDSTISESPAMKKNVKIEIPIESLFKDLVQSPIKISEGDSFSNAETFDDQVPTLEALLKAPVAGPSGVVGVMKDDEKSLNSRSASSVTLTASETEQLDIVHPPLPMTAECTRRKRKRNYPGDLGTSDFSTPEKRRKNLKLLKDDLSKSRKKIKGLQRTNRRLRRKVTTMKDLLKQLKDKQLISEESAISIKASLSGVSNDLFERMLQGPTKQKYNEKLRSFALTLSFYSTKAYNYVRDTFNKSLPDTSTISKWFRSIDGGPGFTQESLNALRLKKQESNWDLFGNLVFDEMSIRKLVEWTGKKFSGYVDVGTKMNADTLEEAREVLVFLVTSLNGSWKIPVGYFFISSLSAKEKSGLVIKCLEFLYDEGRSGITITSLTFDGPPTNFAVAEELGADFHDKRNLKTSFPHPKTQHTQTA